MFQFLKALFTSKTTAAEERQPFGIHLLTARLERLEELRNEEATDFAQLELRVGHHYRDLSSRITMLETETRKAKADARVVDQKSEPKPKSQYPRTSVSESRRESNMTVSPSTTDNSSLTNAVVMAAVLSDSSPSSSRSCGSSSSYSDSSSSSSSSYSDSSSSSSSSSSCD
jgi:hypothetical protein